MAHLSPIAKIINGETPFANTMPPYHTDAPLNSLGVKHVLTLEKIVPGHVVLGLRSEWNHEDDVEVLVPCVGVVRAVHRTRVDGEEKIRLYFENTWPTPNYIEGAARDSVEIATSVAFEVVFARFLTTDGATPSVAERDLVPLIESLRSELPEHVGVKVRVTAQGPANPLPLPPTGTEEE